jgi:excinuclease UvrABC helicase subunit UvrB
MNNRELFKKFEEILKEVLKLDSNDNSPNENTNGRWRKVVKTSEDGLTSIQYIMDNFFGEWSEPNRDELKDLEKQLDYHIKNQEFEQAVIIRDKIKEIKNNSSKVKELKRELEHAISKQDFERAIEIRDELKKIN